MIPSARFINIQSHTDTVIDFHPGINLICGESDVGKSAIVRGLEWWALNKPPRHGGDIRRHETKGSSVEIKGVKKFRSASNHYYEVDGTRFKALRTAVPQEVQNTINLSEASFQGQHSPYFLISDSPGDVAKALNAVGDLTIIDLSLKAARAKSKEAATEGKFLKDEFKEKTDKIDALSWAVGANKDYKVIETLKIEAAEIEIRLLAEAVSTVEFLQEKLNGFLPTKEDIIQISKSLVDLKIDETLPAAVVRVEENQVTIPETWVALQVVISSLEALEVDETLGHVVAKVEENEVKIPETHEDLLEVHRLLTSLEVDPALNAAHECAAEAVAEVRSYPEEIDDVRSIQERLITATHNCKELESRFTEAFVAEDCSAVATAAHEEGKMEFNDKLKELGQCPLCGGGLDEDHTSK